MISTGKWSDDTTIAVQIVTESSHMFYGRVVAALFEIPGMCCKELVQRAGEAHLSRFLIAGPETLGFVPNIAVERLKKLFQIVMVRIGIRSTKAIVQGLQCPLDRQREHHDQNLSGPCDQLLFPGQRVGRGKSYGSGAEHFIMPLP